MKIGKKLAEIYDVVSMEDINMGKSTGKSGRHRGLLDVGFYELRTNIQYQMVNYGKSVVFVNPAYSSKECTRCHYVNKGITLADRVFVCPRCEWAIESNVNSGIIVMERAGWESAVELRPLLLMRQGDAVNQEAKPVRAG